MKVDFKFKEDQIITVVKTGRRGRIVHRVPVGTYANTLFNKYIVFIETGEELIYSEPQLKEYK